MSTTTKSLLNEVSQYVSVIDSLTNRHDGQEDVLLTAMATEYENSENKDALVLALFSKILANTALSSSKGGIFISGTRYQLGMDSDGSNYLLLENYDHDSDFSINIKNADGPVGVLEFKKLKETGLFALNGLRQERS